MRSPVVTFLLLLNLVGMGCGDSNRKPQLKLETAASVIEAPQDFRGHCVLSAGAAGPLQYNAHLSSITSLIFQIKNNAGQLVPLLPPPVPNPEAIEKGARELAAGEAIELELTGLPVSSSFMPQGLYTLRVALEIQEEQGGKSALSSNWLEIEVR